MNRFVYAVCTLLPLIAVAGALLLWRWKRRSVAGVDDDRVVRTASLVRARGESLSYWLGWSATLIPVALTAGLLRTKWNMLPERFPVHWGFNGVADRWAQRSAGSVFGVLLLGILLTLMLAAIGELVARSSPGHEGRAAMIRMTRTILLVCSWFVTVLFCGISLLPLARDTTALTAVLLLGSCLFSLGLISFVTYRSLAMAPTVVAAQHTTDAQFWHAGLFYFNPNDSALMVPKRIGFGHTLNFGRPLAWVILGLILLVPLVLPLLLHVSGKH